jgi:hypothetical protein
MRSTGGETDQHIALLDVFARQDLLAFEHADDGPGHVELAGQIHARHLSRLAAKQHHACLPAGFCNP